MKTRIRFKRIDAGAKKASNILAADGRAFDVIVDAYNRFTIFLAGTTQIAWEGNSDSNAATLRMVKKALRTLGVVFLDESRISNKQKKLMSEGKQTQQFQQGVV